MSRIHIALNTSRFDESLAFYSKLFDTAPAKVRDNWAKFDLQEPALNFTLNRSAKEPGQGEISHLGIEVDDSDAGNGAIVGFGAAKSSFVASTFFAPSGFLGAIGVTTAATPLGWAIAAGVIGAGLSLVIGKQFVRGTSSEVRSIPSYINTPMDLLAIGLFDLMGMLSVKLALVDGHLHQHEEYLVDKLGKILGIPHPMVVEQKLKALRSSKD